MEKGIDLHFDECMGGYVRKALLLVRQNVVFIIYIEGDSGLDAINVRSLDWKPVQLSLQKSFECLKACHLKIYFVEIL